MLAHTKTSCSINGAIRGAPVMPRRNAFITKPAAPLVSRRRSSTVTKAVILPPLVPIVARAITAGVLFYTSMNWVFYRGNRRDVSNPLGLLG